MKSKWPINDVEQNTICIRSLTRLLESTIGAVADETRISYWQGVDDEGGSIEIQLLVDMLSSDELDIIRHFENEEMKDGEPRTRVMVQWIWDDNYRAYLLKKWETDVKEEYPNSKFVEHFVVNIEMEFSKNDWSKMIAGANVVKDGVKSGSN